MVRKDARIRDEEIKKFNNQVNAWTTARSQLNLLRFTAESDLDSNSLVELVTEVPVCEWFQKSFINS